MPAKVEGEYSTCWTATNNKKLAAKRINRGNMFNIFSSN